MRAIFLCFVLPTLIFPNVDDNELWSSIGIEKGLTKKIDLEFEQEARFKENLSSFKKTFSDVSLSYKITSSIRCAGDYRVIVYQDRVATRLALNGYYKKSIGLISIMYRLRIQQEADPNDNLPENLGRNRLSIRYRWKKRLSPYLEGELFHRIWKPSFRWEKFRFTVGMRTKLTSMLTIKSYYRLQKEVNISKPETVNVWGMEFGFSL